MFEIVFFLVITGISFMGGSAYIVNKCVENEKFYAPIQHCEKHSCETKVTKFKCKEVEPRNED